MTETIYDAIASVAFFALPVLVAGIVEQRKIEKERKKRDQELLLDYKIAMACERAVEADRQAWKNRVRHTIENWEPIEWPDVRKPRKWGRHAN